MFKSLLKSFVWLLIFVFIIIKDGQISDFINIFVGIIAVYLIVISAVPIKFDTIFKDVSRFELMLDLIVLIVLSVTFFIFGGYFVGGALLVGIFLVLNKTFN